MAFDRAGLKRIGGQNSNSPTIWTYKTADTLATVDGAGYFNNAAARLKVGDLIYTYTTTGPAFGLTVVNANSRDLTASPPVSGVVDVANHVSLGTIDSD